MLTKFWDKVGENLASDWNAKTLSLAFIFWGLGFVTYNLRYGWDQAQKSFESVGNSAILGGVWIIGLLILIFLSNSLIGWLTTPILKLIEGYWPVKIRDRLSKLEINRRIGLKNELNRLLRRKEQQDFGISEFQKLAKLEFYLQYYFPANEGLILPTSLGNILRSAEEYPLRVYGLDVTITWPHMWLVMPDYSRREILAARLKLNESVQAFIWIMLILVWTIFQWWLLLVVIVGITIFWIKINENAFAYAQLLRAIYDLHRFQLYEALHWAPQKSVESEIDRGKSLTSYLFRHQSNQLISKP